jgi:hypothetical protein
MMMTEGAPLMMMENYGIDYRPVSNGQEIPASMKDDDDMVSTIALNTTGHIGEMLSS